MLQPRNKTEAAGTFARFIERFHLKAQQKKKQIRRALRFQIRSVYHRKADPVLRPQRAKSDKERRFQISIEQLLDLCL